MTGICSAQFVEEVSLMPSTSCGQLAASSAQTSMITKWWQVRTTLIQIKRMSSPLLKGLLSIQGGMVTLAMELPADDQMLPHGFTCYITGWGVTDMWGNTAHILQVAPVSVVEHPISSQPEWWGSMAQKNMVCAGGDVVVAGCQGDSGGPLSCFTDRAWRVYSVVSYGPAGMCNQYKKPTSLHQSVFLLRPELLSYQILKKHVVHTVTWSHLNKMKLHHSFCVFLHCMLSL
uniref:Peptidase S1 domain-containing protein n=1 Tax=Takifugu rubripes TaxID=31033 RepID=A0A674MIE6_TAKRU